MSTSSALKSSSQPTIAIMNGSARTATHLAQLALANGSLVHLIVRSAKRVDRALTEPNPSSKLHVHELPDIFSPTALRPILVEVDYVVLVFVPPPKDIVGPTSLNQDGAIAAVSAIVAGTPAGQKPRTKVMLLSSHIVHPDAKGFERTAATAMMPGQMADLARTQAYLSRQNAWGLEWVTVNPGQIVEAEPEEPEAVCREEVRITTSATELAHRRISYGRLGGSFLKIMAEWERWQGQAVVPVPLSDSITGASDFAPVMIVTGKRLLKTATWWTALLAVGWQIGSHFGDFGSSAWLHGVITRWH